MKKYAIIFLLSFVLVGGAGAQSVIDYVNPFIGTTNYGTANPGAVCPNSLMSVVPFNVMGSEDNRYDKDSQWWSTPYDVTNSFLTGFSHVNLSGVGCPDLGSLLLMPSTGELNCDYKEYGSTYTNEEASPGYYTNTLSKYGIKCEVTATERVGVSRFTFPAGQSNILMNLGEGLTNESGAMLRRVSDTEIEGMKLLGTFGYNAQAVFPIYFVMRVSKAPQSMGYWKKQRLMKGIEHEWDKDSGKIKIYKKYGREIMGDDIGAYFTFDTSEGEEIEVQVAVSFVSMANARLNLEAEASGKNFSTVHTEARSKWESDLSRITVEGGTLEEKQIFYTALYHALIHPNKINDVNGEYPAMESSEVGTTNGNRYTVFSLWDTYRNVHQLLTIAYPERQLDMIKSMIGMYEEHGWLPKWELYSRETHVMNGDPAVPVIVDSWMKGLRDFDIDLAYEAMYKSAFTAGADNYIRPDNDFFSEHNYVPLINTYDHSVSQALEYYVADYALYTLAKELGNKEDAKRLYTRSMGYKNYYCNSFGVMRPKLEDGSFYSPFNPMQGANFEPVPGFHEGNAWNYTFFVPHDIKGLSKLMGGNKAFITKLQKVFDEGYYDPANEPNIAYPYLFSYFKGEEWRTQKTVYELLHKHFTTEPDGIPGNDDTGTMSTWAVFSMMGLYPDCPGVPYYTLTTPTFDRVTIDLSNKYYKHDKLVIEREVTSTDDSWKEIETIKLDGKKINNYRLSHEELFNSEKLTIQTK